MPTSAALSWWHDARFGMFIHWGLYALLARHEWTMYQESIPPEEYGGLAERFDPQHYNPEEWVALAQDAGMRYMILTSRHHEGFSLWDSKVSDFTAPKTAARRDLLAEFVNACEKRGMRYGFYYSLLDWRYPAYFRGKARDPEGWAEFLAYVHAQVLELCTNYGDLSVLWYDGGWPYTPEDWDSTPLNAEVRRLPPRHSHQRPLHAARGLRHPGAARHALPGPAVGKLHDHEHDLGLFHDRPGMEVPAATHSLPGHRGQRRRELPA